VTIDFRNEKSINLERWTTRSEEKTPYNSVQNKAAGFAII
jgi:hypothetical protein